MYDMNNITAELRVYEIYYVRLLIQKCSTILIAQADIKQNKTVEQKLKS